MLKKGHVVICDRYVASGLVIQRFDHVDSAFLWQINDQVTRPDLAVILEADPDVIARRLEERGPHNRFQRSPETSRREVNYFHQATETLEAAGVELLRVDCTQRPPEQSAAVIYRELVTDDQWPRRANNRCVLLAVLATTHGWPEPC